MIRILFEFLRWFPVAIFGAALAIAGAFDGVAEWLASNASTAVRLLTSPWNATCALAALGLYLTLLIWSGNQVGRDRPKLVGKIRHVIHGTRDPVSGEWQLLAELEIRNVGSMATAVSLDSWRVAIATGRFELSTKIVAVVVPFVIPQPFPAQPLAFHPERSIHEVMRTPLEIGAIAHGYAYALLNDELHALIPVIRQCRIYFEDVLGRTYRAQSPMSAPVPEEGRFFAAAEPKSSAVGARPKGAQDHTSET